MIIYETRGLSCLLTVRGSVLPHIWLRSLLVGLLGTLILLLQYFKVIDTAINTTAHTFLALVLSLLLLFRTNSCNDRYMEGRRLIGVVNNSSRNLIRQACAYVHGSDDTAYEIKNDIRRLLCALFIAIHVHVSKQYDRSDLQPYLSPSELELLERSSAYPQTIGLWMSHLLEKAVSQKRLTEKRLMMLDGNLNNIIEAWGGMLRIQSTPTPFAYAHHIKVFMHVYCFSLPFALLSQMGMVTPVAAMLIAYALFGIDEIGVEIEEPFGDDANDLPLQEIARSFVGLGADTLAMHMNTKGLTVPK
eukprot:TRINITY_DN4455_c0_g2_i1.p1 TRINITY_DN4455_c0_g2~~TRINITY_DN4455_c0_g2_i1.p1  ORF type:complete len:303 (+),score=52.65 TRINITY_DN4455_c0_g2_i1:89-997(+)